MTEVVYPYTNLRFRLEVGDTTLVAFAECGGLSMEVGTEDYHEGGENRFVHKLPVHGQQSNLVLKRGMTENRELWDWFAKYLETGLVTAKDGQVNLYASPDPQAKAVKSWAFTRAYPVKWTGPELNATSPGVAFETVELVHRGVRLVAVES
ncbi:MAG: phage tail protein [Actinomycetota bacterium]|nr:phage tail protein [Actinomycetota bacterium]